jgi:phospholipase/carboxylesterase
MSTWPEPLGFVEKETGLRPTATVIWLHGLGADGHDFVPLLPELDLSGCPPLRFVFPHAPHQPVTLNGGHVMRAWYDILGTGAHVQHDAAGIHRSALAIGELLARERDRGIADDRVVLAGFSQGAAMALHTGLRWPHRLAGVVALSGYLPLPHTLVTERHPANAQTPVFMAHGAHDTVVLPLRGETSRDLLREQGQPVQWHRYDMAHSLHPDEVDDIGAFLAQVLGAG